jgi:peptidoglycan-associated lipoprotein
MRKDLNILLALILALTLAAMTGACSKKVVPAPATKAVEPAQPKPTTPPPAAPTISVSANPSTIVKGQSTVLSWKSNNATTVELDGGIGAVASAGHVNLTPTSSVTYTARASGAGGTTAASTRITVEIPVTPPTPPNLSDQEFFDKRIQDLFFDYDKFDIRQDEIKIMDANVKAMKERPDLKFIIEGHCDERGSEKYNLALGDRRANEVKAYLVRAGIAAERIETTSYGKERPFDPGHNEESWAKNRRGHFVLR